MNRQGYFLMHSFYFRPYTVKSINLEFSESDIASLNTTLHISSLEFLTLQFGYIGLDVYSESILLAEFSMRDTIIRKGLANFVIESKFSSEESAAFAILDLFEKIKTGFTSISFKNIRFGPSARNLCLSFPLLSIPIPLDFNSGNTTHSFSNKFLAIEEDWFANIRFEQTGISIHFDGHLLSPIPFQIKIGYLTGVMESFDTRAYVASIESENAYIASNDMKSNVDMKFLIPENQVFVKYLVDSVLNASLPAVSFTGLRFGKNRQDAISIFSKLSFSTAEFKFVKKSNESSNYIEVSQVRKILDFYITIKSKLNLNVEEVSLKSSIFIKKVEIAKPTIDRLSLEPKCSKTVTLKSNPTLSGYFDLWNLYFIPAER